MNVLQPNKKTSIITLLTNGVSQREIGRKVRVDRKTLKICFTYYELRNRFHHD